MNTTDRARLIDLHRVVNPGYDYAADETWSMYGDFAAAHRVTKTRRAQRELTYDCGDSQDGTHNWYGEDNRCMDCDRKPWYETATVEGRARRAAREAARDLEVAIADWSAEDSAAIEAAHR
jgi:hypothetical protein